MAERSDSDDDDDDEDEELEASSGRGTCEGMSLSANNGVVGNGRTSAPDLRKRNVFS